MSASYPPISDYGIIGDCRTAALVSRHGSIDWCCFPNFDGPSFFGRLLDIRKGGYFSIRPAGPYQHRQAYIEGTNVLTTTFDTAEGSVRLTDFMPAVSPSGERHMLLPMRQIVRVLEGVSGRVEMALEYRPRPYYGAGRCRIDVRSPYNMVAQGRRWHLHLLAERPLAVDGDGASGSFAMAAGERAAFSLVYDETAPSVYPAVGQMADHLLAETVSFWRAWLRQCRYQGRYLEAVQRSALVLKLLEFVPSGAIIAAPTTSLPERMGGVRNWDYRFCWLRDASLTLQALQSIGYFAEARVFLDWLLHATALTHPRLQVVYSIYGEASLPQRELGHLEGYRGSRPVRVGNQAHAQYQLDIYGEVLDGLFRTSPQECKYSRDVRSLVAGIADFVSRHWPDADNGIWEMQYRAEFTHSRALCWLALDRAIRLLSACPVKPERVQRWKQARDSIARAVLEQGYSQEAGAFTQRLGGRDLDAALLVLPILGLVDASDPRMTSTVKAVRQRLAANRLVYRYLADDGLPPGEGAFLACTFWLAQCLALQGDVAGARQVFERALQCANHLGLLAEEADPATLEMLGNFPQGLTHIGLINAAVAIGQAEGYASE